MCARVRPGLNIKSPSCRGAVRQLVQEELCFFSCPGDCDGMTSRAPSQYSCPMMEVQRSMPSAPLLRVMS